MTFALGGMGHVEDCQIWGNAEAGVGVGGNGSEAVVAGCKCASEGPGAPVFLSSCLHLTKLESFAPQFFCF